MRQLILKNIYSFVSIIEDFVDRGERFYNFDEDFFIEASLKFSKETLLHQYIFVCLLNYHRQDFRANGDLFDEDTYDYWENLFFSYKVDMKLPEFSDEYLAFDWINDNQDVFESLFEKITDEVFFILFSNRELLLNFNLLTALEVKEVVYPDSALTENGTIKRCRLPAWVKQAVFHRDKGRCVFCNTDLTGIVNTLIVKNFDHILPLDLFGANDVSNMQLTCEKCNKKKSNSQAKTGKKYQPWWS
jgi:hypothetical protein